MVDTPTPSAAPKPRALLNPNVILICITLVLAAIGIPVARALDRPMKEFRAAADVTCPSVGTAPISIAPANAKSICVTNTGTTCVRLGNIDGGIGEATTALGTQVGSGCAAGKIFCADVEKFGCMAESSTAVVGVSYGALQ